MYENVPGKLRLMSEINEKVPAILIVKIGLYLNLGDAFGDVRRV